MPCKYINMRRKKDVERNKSPTQETLNLLIDADNITIAMKIKKSRIQETPNLLTYADSSPEIFFPLALKKGLIAFFLANLKFYPLPLPRAPA